MPALVLDHELAVENEIIVGNRSQGLGDLGKLRRGVAPAPIHELGLAAPLRRQHPKAIELELEEPAVFGEGSVARLTEL